MPTMVMSHPPKTTGTTMRSKRPKNKLDKILPISYMYVGTPKKKFTFYVRERLVYRSNVEVTYDDVYNYLANITNDDTVSLHYSVNGTYVPITTTGQLHTFIRLVHNDPNAFLYVENHDYVWNVTPQSKGHKMEKRNPNSEAADPEDDDEEVTASEGEGEEDEEDEEETDSSSSGSPCPVFDFDEERRDVGSEEYDDEEDDEEYDEDEDEEEEEEQDAESIYGVEEDRIPITDPNARVVKATLETKPFAEPQLRVEFEKVNIGDEKSRTSTSPESVQSAVPEIVKVCESEEESYSHLKEILAESLSNASMAQAPALIAQQILQDVWNPSVPYNEHVFKGAVSILQISLGTGLVYYYQKLLAKFAPTEEIHAENISLEKMIINQYMPSHDPELLEEFLSNATIAACDILECKQNLNRLEKEISYFNALYDNCQTAAVKTNRVDSLPPQSEITQHVNAALSSAHYGYQVLQPCFPKDCQCRVAIQKLTDQLMKMMTVLTNLKPNTTDTLLETKFFVVETLKNFMHNYFVTKCSLHASVDYALVDAESYKWRPENEAEKKWYELSQRGMNRLKLVPRIGEIVLENPIIYARKPEMLANPVNPELCPITEMTVVTGVHCQVQQDMVPVDKPPSTSTAQPSLNVSTQAIPENATTNHTSTAPVVNMDDAVVAPAASSATSTVTTTEGESKKDNMSPMLRKMVDDMYKGARPPHNYVYPPIPKPGAILIPTGGFAKCRCSKNCTEELMEPAYEYIERFNEPRTPSWEKTKQKRFKKN